MEFVSPEGLRLDGRRPKELRKMQCSLGVLPAANGSASFQMGNTTVIAAVYGPHQVAMRRDEVQHSAVVRCEYGMATFSTGERRKKRKGDRRSKEISLVIRQAMESAILLELLPRTQIDIFVQVLQADGGTRSACINAASLALAHAGIPMKDMVVSCAAGFLNSTSLLDLNFAEDSGGGPDLTVGYLPCLDKVTLLQMDSKLSIDAMEGVLELAVNGCRSIGQKMKEALLEHTERLATMRGPRQL